MSSLLDDLALASSAPGGIERIRDRILELAMSGRLTESTSFDGTGLSLIAEMGASRAKTKRKRNESGSEPARAHPERSTWCIASLGSLAQKLTDGSHNPPRDSGRGHPMLSSQNVSNGFIDFGRASRFLSPEDFAEEDRRTEVAPGDVLLTIVASIGRSAVVGTDAPKFALQRSVAVIRTKLVPEFLSLFLRSPAAQSYFWKHAKGTAQKGIYLGKLSELEAPVPPLAEQHRIVAKVDELMALCDRLEARQQDAEAAHARLVQALLDGLAQARDADEFQACWQRVAEQFGTLFVSESSLEALRQAVIDCATSGQFQPSTGSTEWRDGCLGDLVVESGSGWSPSCEARQRNGTEWGVLKVSAVSWGSFRPDENKALPASLAARPELEVRPGDFLISRANTADLVARSVFVETTPPKLMLSDKIVRLRFSDACEPRFAQLANSSTAARHYYAEVAGGTSSSMKNVTRSQILALPIRYPGLAEQRRIVAKVTELLALCDQLKARIAAARAKHAQLAEALVTQAVAV